jgi:hypothetical protein
MVGSIKRLLSGKKNKTKECLPLKREGGFFV